MRNFLLWLLKGYQKFFTLLSFGSCRYYPTCSEYAKWQIRYNSLFFALIAVISRILRCNKFFRGGIDYPKIRAQRLKKFNFLIKQNSEINILIWFVPTSPTTFYIVKNFCNRIN